MMINKMLKIFSISHENKMASISVNRNKWEKTQQICMDEVIKARVVNLITREQKSWRLQVVVVF